MHQIGFQLLPHEGCARGAHAYHFHPSVGEALNRLDADVFRMAADDDNTFIQGKMDNTAHRRWLDGSILRA